MSLSISGRKFAHNIIKIYFYIIMALKSLPRIKNFNDMCDTYDTNDTFRSKKQNVAETFGCYKIISYLCSYVLQTDRKET